MALLLELVVGLVLRPLLLAKLSFQIGARSLCVVVLTWLEVLRYALCLHFVIMWRLAVWIMAVLSLPVRAFTALYRERTLETQLHRLRNEMEDVLLDTKWLEEQLHEAIKGRATMEMLLMELEKEHDEAILKIKLLEGEVRDLKNEAQRLKEIQGKALWSYLDQDGRHLTGTDNTSESPYRLDYDKKQAIEDLCKDEMMIFTRMISKEGVLARQREVALSRSLFSVLLSLVVGVIIWEAKDPCMPLVIALFVVVTMSLLSVLQLFARIEHKPASESLALLSINWFILGTLAYPVLPRIARLVGPSALSFLRQGLE